MKTLDVRPYLDRLENLIDLEHVRKTQEVQRRAFAFEPVDHIPTAIGYSVAPGEWPAFGFAEIYADRARMLLAELGSVYAGAKLKDDRLYGIRANYGTGIVASLFGCATVAFDHSLPIGTAVQPRQLARILDRGMPDLRGGLMGRALDTVAWYRETLRPYPKLARAVGSQLLDIQGPFDNASIIWGSDIYYAFFDAPDKVKRLIRIVADTIAAVVREHRRVDGCPLTEQDGDWRHLGGLCIRNDSSINLSGEQYAEFVKPGDARLLGEFGGWIHFCGRAHQWWPRMLDLRGLKGINPYQGEFYDPVAVFEECEAARVAIVQWTTPLDARARARIRTGFSRYAWVKDYDEACAARDRLHATGHVDGRAAKRHAQAGARRKKPVRSG